jgi:hypothetical protein
MTSKTLIRRIISHFMNSQCLIHLGTRTSPTSAITELAVKIVIYGFIIVGAFFTLLVPASVIIGIDPFKYYSEFFNNPPITQHFLFTIVCRIVLQMISWHSVLRTGLVTCMSSLILLLQVNCVIRSLRRRGNLIRSVQDYRRLLHLYNRLRIALKIICMHFWLVLCATLPSSGGLMTVFGIFASVRFYSVVPIHVYVFMPTLAIFMLLLTPMMFHPIVNVHDGTEGFLLEWKRTCAKNALMKLSRRVWMREFRAQKPCAVGGGLFGVQMFIYKNSTKSTYYWLLISYSVDALISVPQKYIIRSFQ